MYARAASILRTFHFFANDVRGSAKQQRILTANFTLSTSAFQILRAKEVIGFFPHSYSSKLAEIK